MSSAVAGPSGSSHAEDGGEGVVEPQLRRGAREEVVVLGQLPPDLVPVDSGRRAVHGVDTECLEANALAVHEAEQVVVPRHQLERRVAVQRSSASWRGLQCPCGLTIGRRPGRLVEASCHVPNSGFRREQAVRVEHDCKALQSLIGLATLPRHGQESSHV